MAVPISPVGGLFRYRDEQTRKTEVIRNASVEEELRDYRGYLPGAPETQSNTQPGSGGT